MKARYYWHAKPNVPARHTGRRKNFKKKERKKATQIDIVSQTERRRRTTTTTKKGRGRKTKNKGTWNEQKKGRRRNR